MSENEFLLPDVKDYEYTNEKYPTGTQFTLAYINGTDMRHISTKPLSKLDQKNVEVATLSNVQRNYNPLLGRGSVSKPYYIGMNTNINCDECNTPVVIDHFGELVCPECGLVLVEDVGLDVYEVDREEYVETIMQGGHVLFAPYAPSEIGLPEPELFSIPGKKTKYSRLSVYKGIKYDSTWEIAVQHWANQNGKHFIYHDSRATFVLPNGKKYEGDFWNEDDECVIEVKGKELGNQKTKRDQAMKHFGVRIEVWDFKKLQSLGIKVSGVRTFSNKGSVYRGNQTKILKNHRMSTILFWAKKLGKVSTADLRRRVIESNMPISGTEFLRLIQTLVDNKRLSMERIQNKTGESNKRQPYLVTYLH